MTKIIFLTLAIISLVSSFNLIQTQDIVVPNDDRVVVDFYFESLCPYCQQFISTQLKTALATKDFWKICNFHLYPYGNAKRTLNGSLWSFTCQHGVRQCEGNLLESCAIKLNQADYYTKALPFIVCLEGDTSNWTTQGQKCANQVGISWDAISKCISSKQGNDFQVEFAKNTEDLVPAHTYVPWITVNGNHSPNSEDSVRSGFVRYVCSIYRGTEKIAACQ